MCVFVCVSPCDETKCVCVSCPWCVSERGAAVWSRANRAVRKARICTAAGTQRERVRERVLNRQTCLSLSLSLSDICLKEDTANTLQDIERQ